MIKCGVQRSACAHSAAVADVPLILAISHRAVSTVVAVWLTKSRRRSEEVPACGGTLRSNGSHSPTRGQMDKKLRDRANI